LPAPSPSGRKLPGNMYLIGLTGNIATGKTTVCNILRTLGAQIIDADQLVHRLLAKGQPVYDQVVAAFGPTILAASGEIERARLGRIVFADPAALRRLEAMTHPVVDALVQQEVAASTAPVVVVDAVKLLESGLSRRCDAVWVVTADEDQQFERLTQKRGMSADDARQRLRAQAPQNEKVRQADVVIDNSGTLDETEHQVRQAWQRRDAQRARRGEGVTRR
jgi:dephospho-CoA kinase